MEEQNQNTRFFIEKCCPEKFSATLSQFELFLFRASFFTHTTHTDNIMDVQNIRRCIGLTHDFTSALGGLNFSLLLVAGLNSITLLFGIIQNKINAIFRTDARM